MVYAYLPTVSGLFLCLSLATGAAQTNETTSILNLAGRWAGVGVLVPATGPNENFKCVITYFPSQDGSRVRQNLRCKGANHKFDAATYLQIADGQVKGSWEDNVYSLTGTVDGTITQAGFNVLLRGQFFVAKMTVVSSSCEQSITIVPDKGGQMKELAALVKKC